MENGLPEHQHRTTVATYEMTISGKPRRSSLPRLCNHCEEPSCVAACPTKATYKRADGIVVVDSSVCIGCAYCVQNCPYDARFMNEQTRTADIRTNSVQVLKSGKGTRPQVFYLALDGSLQDTVRGESATISQGSSSVKKGV